MFLTGHCHTVIAWQSHDRPHTESHDIRAHSTWIWHTGVTCTRHIARSYYPHISKLHQVRAYQPAIKSKLGREEETIDRSTHQVKGRHGHKLTCVMVMLASNVLTWRLAAYMRCIYIQRNLIRTHWHNNSSWRLKVIIWDLLRV